MVSSGLRKDVWSRRGFREDLRTAEDDEYSRWCKARGYRVPYVVESVVMHSHNYTPEQAYKRRFGEARARHGRISELPHAAHVRWQQRLGKLAGFKQGWKERSTVIS